MRGRLRALSVQLGFNAVLLLRLPALLVLTAWEWQQHALIARSATDVLVLTTHRFSVRPALNPNHRSQTALLASYAQLGSSVPISSTSQSLPVLQVASSELNVVPPTLTVANPAHQATSVL